jgi:hypothetical protein
MAGNARNQAPQAHGPFTDNAPRHAVITEFDIPNDTSPGGDNLWGEATKDFGSIRTVGMRLLSPLVEKHATAASKGDPLQLAFELARRAVAYVTSDVGGTSQQFDLQESDGSAAACWAQMHPRIRALVMQANAMIAVPNERTQEAFMASRRIIAG